MTTTNTIEVAYVSVWDGGYEVETTAQLDPQTGILVEIAAADADDVETLDREYIRSADGAVEADVSTDDSNEYRVTDPAALKALVEHVQASTAPQP